MIVISILIIIIVGLLFTGKSGVEASQQAAIEENVVKRTIWHGQTGCMGILFVAVGVVGLLAILTAMGL